MKVRAPFHVGQEYGGDWILYAFRLDLAWIDRAEWIYYRVQRLASMAERLSLERALAIWKSRRKYTRRKKK